jgi:nitrogen-specific signal transduction histidine kinase
LNCLAPDIFDLPVIGTASVLLGSVLFAIWVWYQHQFPGKRSFMVAEAGMLWWVFTAMMELSNQNLDCKVLWAQLAWPGIILMPSAWAIFLFHYALGQDDTLPQLKKVALWAAPIIVSAVAFTNDYHHLLYTAETRLELVDGRTSAVFGHGPFFYVAVTYVYAFMMAAVAIILTTLRRARPQLRPFFVTLLLVTLTPIAGNLAYILRGVTLFGFDPTPFMFAFVLMAFGWLIMNNRMMDITMIARDLLFDEANTPTIIFDDEGRLSGLNKPALRLMQSENIKVGMSLRDVPQIGPLVRRVVANGQLPVHHSVVWHNKTFDPRLHPLPSPINPRGPTVGWTLTFVDITEQQAHADLMARAAQQAETANRAKSDFLATVSHELRTPLTSILGALEIVQLTSQGKLPEQTNNLVDIAASNTRRLKTLIDDLLDLQRMEQGLMEFHMEKVDMVELVQDAVVANKSYLDKYNVSATVEYTDHPAIVRGDPKRLSQVMNNLLSNAAKFSDGGTTVEVQIRTRKDKTDILVQDHGVGIPPGCEDKVFGRFSQVDAASTRSQGGSGLGLNITQEILEAHDGAIRYESTLGKGTTFIVSLPLA